MSEPVNSNMCLLIFCSFVFYMCQREIQFIQYNYLISTYWGSVERVILCKKYQRGKK